MKNFFGPVYPTYDHQKLIEVFGILPSEKVLDIGGGHNPFLRADHIVEPDTAEGIHRGGQSIPEGVRSRYVTADIHELPFDDKSMDFIYCSHVLEHVQDPAQACRELIRVGKRGFIETPRKWSEFFAGYPSHQWLIDVINNELTFERRQFIESPYLNGLLHAVWRSKRLEENALKKFLNVSCVQFYWQDSFNFHIESSEENSFDYTNRDHAALSHYHFAKNIFLLDAPLQHGIFHAKKALEIQPDNESFLVLVAAYALALDDSALWRDTDRALSDKSVLGATERFLVRAGFRKTALSKLKAHIEKHDHSQ